eukprot:3363096-Rhodomonas_salina.2
MVVTALVTGSPAHSDGRLQPGTENPRRVLLRFAAWPVQSVRGERDIGFDLAVRCVGMCGTEISYGARVYAVLRERMVLWRMRYCIIVCCYAMSGTEMCYSICGTARGYSAMAYAVLRERDVIVAVDDWEVPPRKTAQ